MLRRIIGCGLTALTVLWITVACVLTPPVEGPSSPPVPAVLAIPNVEEGKFNVAFVLVGPISDGGWNHAHNAGRLFLEENVENVHTVYLESVPEGPDGERAIRSLARKGFDAVFTTSFGYMDATEAVAIEFPNQYFVHVSGVKRNDTNFANLFGAMENAKYLAGMVAGARAAADGSFRVGYIGPFPIAEIVRLGNAMTLGVLRTCPSCVVDVRWLFSWLDPVREADAAISLMDAGATVIVTGASTPFPVQMAAERGLYGIPGNDLGACFSAAEACLGVPYWNWGSAYVNLVEDMLSGSFEATDFYYDSADGIVGFSGFMEDQVPQPAVPAHIIPEVREVVAKMASGEFTRFDIFTGPLNDNKGNEVVPEGVVLTQSDLEGIDEQLGFLLGRPGCSICMDWLVEGFVENAEVPK